MVGRISAIAVVVVAMVIGSALAASVMGAAGVSIAIGSGLFGFGGGWLVGRSLDHLELQADSARKRAVGDYTGSMRAVSLHREAAELSTAARQRVDREVHAL
jgi:hypothetical protein